MNMNFGFARCISKKFYSVLQLSKSKVMNSEKVYFRHIVEEEKVDISFLLVVKESRRQFNLSRQQTEKLNALFSRIGTNVHKVVNKGNKKKVSKENITEIVVKLEDVDSNISDESTCLDLFLVKKPIKLRIGDQVYEAVFNAPWVVSICLPQSILAGFPVYPEHFVCLFADKDRNVFNWYSGVSINKSGNKIDDKDIKWELVSSGFTYVPCTQDVGRKLKIECIPGNKNDFGPTVEAISKNVIEAGPGKCPFETRHLFTKEKLRDKSFRCVTYNILADLYCDSEYSRTVLHPYCPPYALHIDYRKQLIVKELLGYNADIVCLQEVDSKIFKACIQPILLAEGYDGFFYKKGKLVAEGLSCFYRKDRFSILEHHHIVLSEALKTEACLETIWDSIKNNDLLVERILNRSTAASATVLQSSDNCNEIIVVGNTHLYFHPDADHIRLLQGGIVIYWLNNIKKEIVAKFPDKRISLILSGDFNSVPSCGIYQLYTTGLAPQFLADWKSNADEAVYGLSLKQEIILASACGTPRFTNFTTGFADCLDYIFYEIENLEVEQVIPLPSMEELEAHIALPSIVFPSDHIALISDLRFL